MGPIPPQKSEDVHEPTAIVYLMRFYSPEIVFKKIFLPKIEIGISNNWTSMVTELVMVAQILPVVPSRKV